MQSAAFSEGLGTPLAGMRATTEKEKSPTLYFYMIGERKNESLDRS